MSRRIIPTLALTAVVLACLLYAVPASACMNPECSPWIRICPDQPFQPASGLAAPGTTLVTRTGADRALIQVGHYTTPQMSVTYACSVAFPLVEGIAHIDRVSLVASSTGLPLGNYNWVQNNASIDQFANLVDREADMSHMGDVRYQAFFTKVLGGSQGGIDHSFVFEVTLKPGTTVPQLVSALRAQGVLANGSANFDGTLNYGHYFLRRVGDGLVDVVSSGRPNVTPAPHARPSQPE